MIKLFLPNGTDSSAHTPSIRMLECVCLLVARWIHFVRRQYHQRFYTTAQGRSQAVPVEDSHSTPSSSQSEFIPCSGILLGQPQRVSIEPLAKNNFACPFVCHASECEPRLWTLDRAVSCSYRCLFCQFLLSFTLHNKTDYKQKLNNSLWFFSAIHGIWLLLLFMIRHIPKCRP